jgi:hypothetical protein
MRGGSAQESATTWLRIGGRKMKTPTSIFGSVGHCGLPAAQPING